MQEVGRANEIGDGDEKAGLRDSGVEGPYKREKSFSIEVLQRAYWGGEVGVVLFCFSERTVASVAGVHSEVSEPAGAVNKSEVYSHYLGLLFYCILSQLLSGPTKQ